MKKMRIGQLLVRHKDAINIEDDKEYSRLTIKTNHKGVYLRDIETGVNIGTKKQFRVCSGDFILSKIDARQGAFGIIPEEGDGAVITGNFWSYKVDTNEIDTEWFLHFTNSPMFLDLCKRSSTGNTHRKYLDEKIFLSHELNIPGRGEQEQQLAIYRKHKKIGSDLLIEIENQQTFLAELKQAILLEAIQGKLTSDWRGKNKDVVSASELLLEIGKKKSLLLKERKIKKVKSLPEITPQEITYKIPTSWAWCRFGDLTKLVTSGSRGWKSYYADSGALFIRAQNINSDILDLTQSVFVDLPVNLEGQRTRVMCDDILVTITGGNCGKTARITDDITEAYVSQHIALTRPVVPDLSPWLHNCLISDYGPRGVLLSYSKGDKPGLNLPNVRTVPIPVPPIAEQIAIAERVDFLMNICNKLASEIEQARIESTDILKAILKEAFTSQGI